MTTYFSIFDHFTLRKCIYNSKTFPVDNLGPTLIVFIFSNPHGLESVQTRQNRPTQPGLVRAVRRTQNLIHSLTFLERWAHRFISYWKRSGNPLNLNYIRTSRSLLWLLGSIQVPIECLNGIWKSTSWPVLIQEGSCILFKSIPGRRLGVK